MNESHRFASNAVGAHAISFEDSFRGRARLRAADSSSEEPLDEVIEACLSRREGTTTQTSAEATLGEMNRGRTPEESFRSSSPAPPSIANALDMRETKLPMILSALFAAELVILNV